MAIIYYFAPDVEQDWVWITPGSVFSTVLWLIISLGFKLYVSHFASYLRLGLEQPGGGTRRVPHAQANPAAKPRVNAAPLVAQPFRVSRLLKNPTYNAEPAELAEPS